MLRVQLNRKWLLALCGVAVVALIVLGHTAYRAVGLQSQAHALQGMRTKILQQYVQMGKLNNHMAVMQVRLEKLQETDHKMRLIANLQKGDNTDAVYGIGGAGVGNNISVKDAKHLPVLDLLEKELGKLEKSLAVQEESFNNLKSHLADRKDIIARTPYRIPVKGFISSTFGMRTDPFTGLPRAHEGLDIAAPAGTPIYATADGLVTFSGTQSGFGNMVVIDHGYGVITRYAHNNTLLAREGQRVKRGQVIATVGTTGHSTGPHLHYEIRINGVSINPLHIMMKARR